MRLFGVPFAPNVTRVQVLLQEKGLALEFVDISADRAGYRAVNPLGQVPALELDDGRIVTESLTICQYLDAASGAPFLFGNDADERLHIGMWERRAEMALFNPSVEYAHHVHPMFAAWMTQFPDFAASLVTRIETAAQVFTDQLDRTPYVAGDQFTAADITAFLGYFSLVGFGPLKAADWPTLRRWAAGLLDRPSLAASRPMAVQFGILQPGG